MGRYITLHQDNTLTQSTLNQYITLTGRDDALTTILLYSTLLKCSPFHKVEMQCIGKCCFDVVAEQWQWGPADCNLT